MKKWRAQQEHISNVSTSPINDNSVQDVDYKTYSHRHSAYPHNNSAHLNQHQMSRYSHDPFHGLHHTNSWDHFYYPSHGEHVPNEIGPYYQWNQHYEYPHDYHPQEYQDNEPLPAHNNQGKNCITLRTFYLINILLKQIHSIIIRWTVQSPISKRTCEKFAR